MQLYLNYYVSKRKYLNLNHWFRQRTCPAILFNGLNDKVFQTFKSYVLCLTSYVFFIGLSLLFTNTITKAEHLPPVSIFDTQIYKGGNQNWMVDQHSDGSIFIANNVGLLVYNGAQWKCYPSANGSILRSVKVVGERVYTGCFMDFGYWEKDEKGDFQYTSLVAELNVKVLAEEQFWNIVYHNELLYIQSLKQLYVYDAKNAQLKKITPNKGVKKLFHLGNALYIHTLGDGIYKIQGAEIQMFYSESSLNNADVLNMFSTDEGIKLLTKEQGFLSYQNETFKTWDIDPKASPYIEDIFSSIQLKNGDFALGTIANGIVVVDKNGKFLYKIDQTEGLSNNTVLSLFEDRASNIWLGLDNGINCVHTASAFKEYIDKQGKLGTVYAAIAFNDKLYIGTNQGLFWKPLNDFGDFQFIPNTNGQVWSLFAHQNALFCGHNNGTFLIESFSNKAKLISKIPGTWRFAAIPGKNNFLIQGNYGGLHLLEAVDGNWKLSNAIDGFGRSAQRFVFLEDKIYVNHPYQGVFELSFDKDFQSLGDERKIEGLPESNPSSLAVWGDDLYYICPDGVFVKSRQNENWQLEQKLSELLKKKSELVQQMSVDEQGRMWLFSDDNITFIEREKEEANVNWRYELQKLPLDKPALQMMHGYEFVSYLGDASYLIGLSNGYLFLDFDKLSTEKKAAKVHITSVELRPKEEDDLLTENLKEQGDFDNDWNNIKFRYAVSKYDKFEPVKFQYKLEGNMSDWSDWTDKPEVSFQNLSSGAYHFQLRSKVGDTLASNTANYKFVIRAPWYWSNWAKLAYLLMALFLAYLINKLYFRNHEIRQKKLIEKNQKELEYIQLKNEQEMVQLKNEKLQAEMEAKNKELAATTMNLIRKNEFLIGLRESLNKDKKNPKFDKHEDLIANVIKDINNELENEATWELFKNAFDSVDKGFLNKIKELHPKLTPNDLKLCAYLRLNLSSKEIAPLLNISVRSMEIKRYRLRKKMMLTHETNLVNYIMSI